MPPEWISFGERFGWLALAVTYAIFKIAPLAIERIWPKLIAARRAEKARVARAISDELSAVQAVYEKFITLQSETIQFVAGATDSIRELNRGLDSNTHQVEKLTDAVNDLCRKV